MRVIINGKSIPITDFQVMHNLKVCGIDLAGCTGLSSLPDNVDVIDPKNRAEFDALVEKRINEDALSVIISRHPCKLLRQ